MQQVAIYARYSSDLQRDESIEDQIRLSTERAGKEGWNVINCYTDAGISGASLIRPGIQALMQDAIAGKFSIVLTEALDRLSRDQEDIAGFYKRMEYAGVKIITLSEGEINTMHIGLKGTMNALFLKDLAAKTHRGQSGRVLKGKSGGGIAYGYNVIKQFDANGEAIKGDREINAEQAKVICRIFHDYANKNTAPRQIALQLNKERIPCPSGSAWGASTIYGNRRRGTGILNNELYIGRLVWNRQKFVKNPDTGKRIARINPQEEWQITEVPDLRIVDQDLWDAVKARQKTLDEKKQLWTTQRPPNLFSYLLKCGCCGGGLSKVSSKRYSCSTSYKKGTCDNRLTIKQDALEHSLLNALQFHLMDKALLTIFCDEYTRHTNALRKGQSSKIVQSQKELEKLAAKKQRIIEAITNGMPASELTEEMNRIVTRREELEAFLNTTQEAPVLLHPNMAHRYQQEVSDLIVALNRDDSRAEAADLLRSLIDKVVLTPKPDGTGYNIELVGDLAGILTIAAGKKKVDKNDPMIDQVKMMIEAREGQDSQTASDHNQVAINSQDIVVAGAGNQRYLLVTETT